MPRWAVLAFAACAVPVTVGCGASAPRESDIFHDPALRPGTVEARDASEQALLERLSTDPSEGELEVGGRVYLVEAPYHSASGRRCRHYRAEGDAGLACESEEGWVRVPDLSRPGAAP